MDTDMTYDMAGGEHSPHYYQADYDDYNGTYEYPEGHTIHSMAPLNDFIPNAVVYGLTLLLGLSGNSLVIFSVVRYKRLRNVTNVFLISLSCADLLLILICVPVKFASFLSFSWELGEFLCKLVHYLQNVSMICSVSTLTVMSLERYYAILWPIQAKYMCTIAHARAVVVGVWFGSLVLAVPILIGQNIQTLQGHHIKLEAHWCKKIWSSKSWSIVYECYMMVILYILPLGIMVFAYSNICLELHHMTWRRASLRAQTSTSNNAGSCLRDDGKGKENTGVSLNGHVAGRPLVRQSNKDDENTRKQVIKMLVAVIVLYAICWGPYLCTNLVGAVRDVEERYRIEKDDDMRPMRQAFYLMAYFNSCINPIVYGLMSKNFRESFKQSLRCCTACNKKSKKPQYASARTTSSITRQASLKANFELEKHKNGTRDEDNLTPDTSMVDEAL